MTIRRWLARLLVAATALTAPTIAGAQDMGEWRHGLSLLGEPKYPADFPHFAYVDPDAPKGGTVRLGAPGTFDSFNPFIVQGNAAPGVLLTYETLMTAALDEASTEYGLIAEAVRHPADFSSAIFKLRPEARFHDGTPITVEDVIWSFETLKKVSPFFGRYYRNVMAAEKTGAHEVTFRFDQAGNRELPQIVGQLLYVLPRHWWEGKDAQGRQRDITRGLLEAPLGSGPYRIKSFSAGRSVTLERVKDYWGKDLPVKRGTDNFDEMRFEFYRDLTVRREAFKADQFDYILENSAKEWATSYAFPAVTAGRVVLEEFDDAGSGLMQAFAFNIRRETFSDVRVRRAFNLALDFTEMNRTLFHGQYERIESYFHGTELASRGLPQGLEKEILESLGDKIPKEILTTPYETPKTDSREAIRANLLEARRLLAEAGWTVKPGERAARNAKGEPLTVELLIVQPDMERAGLFYKPALERLGVDLSIRIVDDTQYTNRERKRDFDMIVARWPQSLSPGNEQRNMWGSDAADEDGSDNSVGIKNPAVDALIDRVIFAKSREELVAATHALDRVLLWNAYVVPQWTITYDRTARWNRFSHPEAMPKRGALFPTVWWYDEAKAAKAGARP